MMAFGLWHMRGSLKRVLAEKRGPKFIWSASINGMTNARGPTAP